MLLIKYEYCLQVELLLDALDFNSPSRLQITPYV